MAHVGRLVKGGTGWGGHGRGCRGRTAGKQVDQGHWKLDLKMEGGGWEQDGPSSYGNCAWGQAGHLGTFME